MRCLACNTRLSDFEATRKFTTSGEYVDLCNHCFDPIRHDVDVSERDDLIEYEDVENDDEEETHD